MKLGALFLLLPVVMALQSCFTQQYVYKQAQDTEWDCRRLPLTQQRECLEQSSISYEEYTKKRQELLESEPDE